MTIADLVARNTALSSEVRRSQEALKIAQLTIDKMKVELTYLRRMKYGRSSEKLEHAQLELVGGQVAQPVILFSAGVVIQTKARSRALTMPTTVSLTGVGTPSCLPSRGIDPLIASTSPRRSAR